MFNSVDSMPQWAQIIVETFPPSHFIKIMRMVVLKGSGFGDILYELGAMFGIGTHIEYLGSVELQEKTSG